MEVLAGGVLKVEILEKREPLWGCKHPYIKIKAVVSIDNLENLAKMFGRGKNIGVASSIMKCNTCEKVKASAILSVYGKTI